MKAPFPTAGSFSWLRYQSSDSGDRALVFKEAKKHDEIDAYQHSLCDLSSRALMMVTGGTMVVEPDCRELLRREHATLTAWQMIDGVVRVGGLEEHPGTSRYQMEYAHGPTGQELLDRRELTIDHFVALSKTIGAIQTSTQTVHGDIKPANFVCATDGIVVLDPGYFGLLETKFGAEDCMVTTPAYYPALVPDDMLALGIILWQIVMAYHPFATTGGAGDTGTTDIDDDLAQYVRERQLVGQHFLTPLLSLNLPRVTDPSLSEQAETILLKALKLRLSPGGKLSRDSGFSSAAELAEAAQLLRS